MTKDYISKLYAQFTLIRKHKKMKLKQNNLKLYHYNKTV